MLNLALRFHLFFWSVPPFLFFFFFLLFTLSQIQSELVLLTRDHLLCLNKWCCLMTSSFLYTFSLLNPLIPFCVNPEFWSVQCIYGFPLFTKNSIFFLISQLWAKFECNVSYTRSHYLIFNIKPILPRAVFSLQYLQHSAQSISVYYKYPPFFFFTIWYPWNWCLRLIESDETNKTSVTCAEYGKIRGSEHI